MSISLREARSISGLTFFLGSIPSKMALLSCEEPGFLGDFEPVIPCERPLGGFEEWREAISMLLLAGVP